MEPNALVTLLDNNLPTHPIINQGHTAVPVLGVCVFSHPQNVILATQ